MKPNPLWKQQLDAYRKAQADDSVCRKVMDYCRPNGLRNPPLSLLGLYWKVLDSLSIHNDLLMYNLRIVVPLSLQKETLQKVHEGHQGIVRCRMRTKMSVWWPGISKHVEEFVQRWPICARDREPRREPLTPTPLPDYPWQVIGSDLVQVM